MSNEWKWYLDVNTVDLPGSSDQEESLSPGLLFSPAVMATEKECANVAEFFSNISNYLRVEAYFL